MPGPLDGVRILEFSEIIAGPFAGMLLSDMGADVIKVEPPWGEPWRTTQQFAPGESKNFIGLNRGKRSLLLDLTKPAALEVVYRLVDTMDAVIINSRPDVPYNLGVDYETLSARNPRLIYCENTAFGRRGPDNYRRGYDIVAQAMTGLMASEGRIVDGVPQQIQASAVADFSTGIAMAWAISAALYSRERTGKGQKIESTLLGTALALQTSRFLQVKDIDDGPRAEFLETLGRLRQSGADYESIDAFYRQRTGPLGVGNIYYRTYRARDGSLAVGCLSDPLRKRLAGVLGLRDIRFEPGYDPYAEVARAFGDELILKAEAVFRQKTVGEWLAVFDREGVPAGPVRMVEELVDDPQVVANGLVVEMEHSTAGPIRMVGPVVQMSETPLRAQTASPSLGQHSAEVLAELGYSDDAVRRLRDDGAIG